MSPSGSVAVAFTPTEQGEPGRGWQDPPPPVLTDGFAFVPVAVPEAWALPPRPSLTVTEHVAVPGADTLQVFVAPPPLAQPLQL